MEAFKEFQGKSLDEAIRGACVYYDAQREKLEIEIVQDAKSGIFGLVGARKAIIHARRATVHTSVGNLLGRPLSASAGGRPSERHAPAERTHPERNRQSPEDARDAREERPASRPAPGADAFSFRTVDMNDAGEEGDEEAWDELSREQPAYPQALPLSRLDQAKLEALTLDAAGRMVTAILGEAPIRITILEHRVEVRVDCSEDSGLLIGREGQTLSALQYLASRIVSRGMDAPVRVQFDVGDYRERQDERLRELALTLAERVRLTGRPCSMRPMSSYHRRLVHMTLQDAPDIQTRSSGDGPLKRIIIQRRRTERTDRPDRADRAERQDRGR